MLEVTLQRLLTELAPSQASAYRRASLALEAVLLECIREEWDRAAARRVEENAALRALFADAALTVEAAPLRARLERAARGADPSLRVADLDAANRELRGLLIELHACVEGSDAPAARRLEAAIWDELRRSTERRRLSVAPF